MSIFGEARERLEKAGHARKCGPIVAAMALAAVRAGDPTSAMRALAQANQLLGAEDRDPASVLSHVRLGTVAQLLGDEDEARRRLSAADSLAEQLRLRGESPVVREADRLRATLGRIAAFGERSLHAM